MRKYILLFALAAMVCASAASAQFNPRQPFYVSEPATAEQFDALMADMDCKDMTNLDLLGAQQKAQQNWQQLCYNSYNKPELKAQLNKLMCDALKKDLPAQTSAWLLRQLRWTATASEVPAIAPFLTKNVMFVVEEAAFTLAQIPGPEAQAALLDAQKNAPPKRVAMLNGALKNRAENLTVGTEIVMPQAIPYVQKDTVDKYLADWKSFDGVLKTRVLASLTVRQDKAYLPLVVDSIQNGSDSVKRAAILSLEKLGTVKELPLLLDYASVDRGLVARIASFIETEGFDEALQATQEKETDAGKFALISEILATRNVDITATLFARAKKADCPNRIDLLRQAQKLSNGQNIGDFVDALVLCSAGGQRDDAERIIAALIPGDASQVIAKMGQYPGSLLFGALGRIGGDAAKDTLNKAVAGSDAELRDAAIKALCNWPNAQGAENLYELSQKDSLDKGQKIAALRAYIRVVSLPDDQIGIRASAADKLGWLQKAFDSSTRLDEKKLVISRLNAIRDVKSLDFALKYINDPELAETVYRAIADLAHHNNLRQPNKDKFGPAMDTVIEKSSDKGLVDRVKRYRELM